MRKINFCALDGIRTTTSCIRGKRLTARPQGTHGRERTTPRLIWKYIESISLKRHPPETTWHMEETPTEGTKIYFSHFILLEWNVKNCFVKLI